MSIRSGGTFLTPILAVAGLVAAGAAGYRVLSGGCGSCADKEHAALVSTTIEDKGECGLCDGHQECDAHTLAASTETKSDGCCASKAKVETVAAEAKSECCMAKDAAAVKTVAAEGKAEKKEGCCSEAGVAAECTGVAGCEGEAKTEKSGCCSEGKKEEKKSESSGS